MNVQAKSFEHMQQNADAELSALSKDLSVELIRNVVRKAFDIHVSDMTGFAPNTGRSTTLYNRATELLRFELARKGWESRDINNVSCITNFNDGVRIACSTDGGSSVGKPSPYCPILRQKGNAIKSLAGSITDNMLTLPGIDPYEIDGTSKDGRRTDFYYLFMHIDDHAREIRIELSRPILDQQGKVVEWSHRILIPSVAMDIEPVVAPQETSAPEIIITRKVS